MLFVDKARNATSPTQLTVLTSLSFFILGMIVVYLMQGTLTKYFKCSISDLEWDFVVFFIPIISKCHYSSLKYDIFI